MCVGEREGGRGREIYREREIEGEKDRESGREREGGQGECKKKTDRYICLVKHPDIS